VAGIPLAVESDLPGRPQKGRWEEGGFEIRAATPEERRLRIAGMLGMCARACAAKTGAVLNVPDVSLVPLFRAISSLPFVRSVPHLKGIGEDWDNAGLYEYTKVLLMQTGSSSKKHGRSVSEPRVEVESAERAGTRRQVRYWYRNSHKTLSYRMLKYPYT